MATATSVEALLPGDRARLMFSDPDERLDLVAAFVRDGIRALRELLYPPDRRPPQRRLIAESPGDR